jgi:hypothetical protein
MACTNEDKAKTVHQILRVRKYHIGDQQELLRDWL